MSDMTNLFWQEEFKVRAYEAGLDGRVTMQSICNYLQEASANHAFAMNVAMDQMLKMNLLWVLSRLHIRLEKYPKWNEIITVETWPSEKSRMFGIRDFRIKTEADGLIGVGTSSWMVIDFKERRAAHLPDFLEEFQNHEQPRALADPFDRLPEINEGREVIQKDFKVRRGDLDMNNHVNSVHYIAWALEIVPPDLWKSHSLRELEINYRSECTLGDQVHSRGQCTSEGSEQYYIHQLFRESDHKEVARLRTLWQQK